MGQHLFAHLIILPHFAHRVGSVDLKMTISGGLPAADLVATINKYVYSGIVTAKEFKRWLAAEGATFKAGKGSHLKVYLNGRQSVLPMHNAELKKGLVDGIRKQLGLK